MYLVCFTQLYSKNRTEEHCYGFDSEALAIGQIIQLGRCANVQDIKLFKVDELHEVPFDVC